MIPAPGDVPHRDDEVFQHLSRVHAYVARRIGPLATVEDVTSEVFADAIRSKVPKGDALPWLLKIARRKVADVYRRRGVRKESSLDDARLAPATRTHEQLIQDEEALTIRGLVDALPDDQREAILLFYVEEFSAKQVGKSMGRSERAVNSLLQRARQKLRESGREYFQEDDSK